MRPDRNTNRALSLIFSASPFMNNTCIKECETAKIFFSLHEKGKETKKRNEKLSVAATVGT